MKRFFFYIVTVMCLIFLIPFIFTITFECNKGDNSFNEQVNKKDYISYDYGKYKTINVLKEDGNIVEMNLDEYLLGVVSAEMPANYDIEALKAQAVAARSYVLTKMIQNINYDYDVVDTISNQVYLDDNILRKNWGSNYDTNISRIKDAVISTRGKYLTYNGEVVNAFFFSTSVGKTENCVDVFGGDLPYLVSVDSSWDEEVSPVFAVEKKYTLNDFYEYLKLPYDDIVNIDILDTTSTGRIKKILINNKEFTGSEVANLLSLRSAFFEINQEADEVIINTKGYGHGVGMSQYGALGMAKHGYNYEEILKHYYTNVEISNL